MISVQYNVAFRAIRNYIDCFNIKRDKSRSTISKQNTQKQLGPHVLFEL